MVRSVITNIGALVALSSLRSVAMGLAEIPVAEKPKQEETPPNLNYERITVAVPRNRKERRAMKKPKP